MFSVVPRGECNCMVKRYDGNLENYLVTLINKVTSRNRENSNIRKNMLCRISKKKEKCLVV